MPITRTVLEVARAHPDRIAVAGPDQVVTYGELVEGSQRTFAAVDTLHRAHPVVPAPETGGIPITAVSLASAFHAARIVAGLAGYRAVSATIDPLWPLAHRVRVIVRSGIGVVISDSTDLAEALSAEGWQGTVIGLDEFAALEARAVPAGPPTVRDGDEAFLLLFSSGTTSDPKAFLKTRAQYRANFAISSAHLEPLPGVATLAPGPLSYSLTLYALIECLASGGGAHLADVFEPAAIARRVRDEGITRVVAVPAVVQALTDAARRDPSAFATLELVVTGGANLPASIRAGLAEALPTVRLISYYGAAEIGFIGDSRGGDGTLISVYTGIGISVRDEAGRPLPEGEAGELWVRAEACSHGYLAGTSTDALVGPDGWATVHDQARAQGGRLALLGRAGDIAVTGGHKVSLAEVERAFDGMPGLGAVCAVALPHPRLGTIVALVLEQSRPPAPVSTDAGEVTAEPATAATGTPRTADIPDKHALRAWARERLAPQYVPRRWYVVPALPRTAGGKIRRGETGALLLADDGRAVRL
ncbi:long-chain fatty acid--CoA ligase [Microbacterium bovistercoris]|uniref:Long-chain fatty acid--CoA ligase n=1 Tax=Microbacterium bovistercoris TaxID=2293570 RepID=A0A371NYT2_9MICO|nr:long-chain fatty acid--CoA ligase [Microbacterium bovistercoris]REJ08245.1 long-chain fatty acid--CoA ligase [Microbacterium bovistercoris]